MTTNILLVALLVLATHPVGEPHAKLYSPGIMERVARNRGMPVVRHMAAVTDCRMIGKHVLASINGRRPTWFRVTDCSHPRDRARHVRSKLVIEVDWNSAVEFGFSRHGHAPARVYGYSAW